MRSEDDFLQELRFCARCARRAGQHVIDEEVQGVGAMLVIGIQNLGDERVYKIGVFNRLRMKTLDLPGFDFIKVSCVDIHINPGAMLLILARILAQAVS